MPMCQTSVESPFTAIVLHSIIRRISSFMVQSRNFTTQRCSRCRYFGMCEASNQNSSTAARNSASVGDCRFGDRYEGEGRRDARAVLVDEHSKTGLVQLIKILKLHRGFERTRR